MRKNFDSIREVVFATLPIAETAQFVRRYPLGAVAAAFGGGVLVGWLVAHELKSLSAGREDRQQQASESKAYKRAISRWEGEGGALISMKTNSKPASL